MKHTFRVIIGLALAFSFSFASFLGVHLSMQGEGMSIMPDCPITGAQQCPMSVTAHVAGWRQLFLATFEKNGFDLMLLGVVAMLGSLVLLKYFRTPHRLAWNRPKRETPDIFSNYLFGTIGSGIVHKRE